jgi:cell division septation protein DedD
VKEEQASEEKLMGELDRMYRHVADLESDQAPVEHHHNPCEDEQISDLVGLSHEKIIPFPVHRIHLPPEEPSVEETRGKGKTSYRPYLMVASFVMVFLALIFFPPLVKKMIDPPSSEKKDSHEFTYPALVTSTPPVMREEDVSHPIGERRQKAEIVPHQTLKSFSPFTQKRYYTVQIGAFRNWENASELIDALQKKDLEAYWIEMDSKSKGSIYFVLSGYFINRNEAAKFMKEKDILKNYPDSFIRWISF